MRVLVTGCGGFLGREIVRQLTERGDAVVGFGRSEYPQLRALGAPVIRGDVRDADAVVRACDGCDAVIHTAAIAGVWGPWQRYYGINTLGTQNVIAGCRSQRVSVLVHSSSPSVTFAGADQRGVDETAPYPRRWLCHYPHTKALAEQAVLAADRPGELRTAALRPHLIWGPDDPHLFPRLIQRARQGRLVQVGPGTNRIDTVHVSNAALAHLLALDALAGRSPYSADGAGGRAFFISQGEPVCCWEWIGQILDLARAPRPRRALSFAAAYRIGATIEAVYRVLRIRAEPPMTRFLAAQLATDHYYDISAARERLGYHAAVSTDAGMQQLAAAWEAGPPGERAAAP